MISSPTKLNECLLIMFSFLISKLLKLTCYVYTWCSILRHESMCEEWEVQYL